MCRAVRLSHIIIGPIHFLSSSPGVPNVTRLEFLPAKDSRPGLPNPDPDEWAVTTTGGCQDMPSRQCTLAKTWVCSQRLKNTKWISDPRTPNPRPTTNSLKHLKLSRATWRYSQHSFWTYSHKTVFDCKTYRFWSQFVPGFVKGTIPAFPSGSRPLYKFIFWLSRGS